MTTQAKNRILAYLVMAMLLTVVIVGNSPVQSATTPVTTTHLTPIFVEIPAAPEPPAFDEAEFDCLRTNIYFEAGNQSDRGMKAVALVTLNRTKTKHYPPTVCGVVKAWAYNKRGKKVCQFSWYCDGKSDVPNLDNPLEVIAWERATMVALQAMQGEIEDFLGRATHYHAHYVNPKWANVPERYRHLAVVGSHLFYRDIKLGLKDSA